MSKVDPFNTIEPWIEQRSPDNDFKTEAHDPNIGRSFVPSDLYRHDQQTVINTIFDYSRTPQTWVYPPSQQMAPSVKFKRLHPDAKIPTYAKTGDAGCDLYLPEDVETNRPGQVLKIPLGFAMEIPDGWEAQIRPRSSSSARGYYVAFGTIDSGYRGEIALIVSNPRCCFKLNAGDRVAQMVFAPVYQATFIEVDELSKSDREGGFGSTGK